MTKHIIILLVGCSTCLLSFGQYQQGDSKFDLSITNSLRFPHIGFGFQRFVTGHLSIGVEGTFRGNTSVAFGSKQNSHLSTTAKYYFKNEGVFRPFAYASIGVKGQSYHFHSERNHTLSRMSLTAETGLGLSVHTGDRFSIEARLGYGLSGNGMRSLHRGLSSDIGVSYTLPHRSRRKK